MAMKTQSLVTLDNLPASEGRAGISNTAVWHESPTSELEKKYQCVRRYDLSWSSHTTGIKDSTYSEFQVS